MGFPLSATGPNIIGKNKAGEHILEIRIMGPGWDQEIYSITGTLEELNELFEKEDLEIVREGERDYEFVEREVNKD